MYNGEVKNCDIYIEEMYNWRKWRGAIRIYLLSDFHDGFSLRLSPE
jgi:hypothetical protein